jgi:hypothetical protein
VAAIELDPQTRQLARIEVSAGFFTSNTWIDAAQITQLGADAIMVADAIALPLDGAAMAPVEAAGTTPA